MDELIARLEAAREGSRELDGRIAWVLAGMPIPDNAAQRIAEADDFGIYVADPYTTSLDAALTLVPEGWFIKLRCGKPVGAEGEFCHCELDCDADSIGRDLDDDEPMYAKALNAPTLPLAVCLASLRARSHTPQEK